MIQERFWLVTKFLSKKGISFIEVIFSGAILAVCSCTILPLFAGIYKRGAGIGPATAFLFSGPAINILAIVLTARVLGFEIGLARVFAAVFMAIVIGLLMSLIFRQHNEDIRNNNEFIGQEGKEEKNKSISLAFFVSLVAILIIATAEISWVIISSDLAGSTVIRTVMPCLLSDCPIRI